MRVLSKRAPALRATAICFLLAALTAGCAMPAEHAALAQAGAAVERARSAPRVRALAAAELDRAEGALEHARAAARAGAPPDQVEHLAYVVSQRAALADARAAERVARSEIGKLQRALGQALAHGRRLERDRPARAPLEQDQRQRTAVQDGQQAGAPLGQNQQQPGSVQEYEQARAPLEQDQQGRAAVQENEQAHP